MSPDENKCPACGARVAGGLEGCQTLMDDIQARAYADPGYATGYDLAFDTYCMQHPEIYGVSAKSYAAHLTRLCCALEHGGDRKIYRAILRLLDGNPVIEKPALLTARGRITVADPRAAQNAVEQNRLVREWAADVWDAYTEQHDQAERWIEAALAMGKTKRRARR
jgi:Family of unknown function (DUF5946)